MIVAFWVLFIIALLIIVFSFLMAPESNSFSGALVGSSDLDLFKQSRERGTKKALKWAMFTCGIGLIIIAVIVRTLG